MDNFETYTEDVFSMTDNNVIANLKRKAKKRLTWLILVQIHIIFLGPFLRGRIGGHMLTDYYSYFDSVLLIFAIDIVFFVLPSSYYYVSSFIDYREGKKIVVRTKIKKIIRKNSKISLLLNCPELKSKPIQIENRQSYLGIAINDYIMISFLPKSKLVLDIKKI